MAGFTLDQAQQMLSASPGTAMLGANTKVKGEGGFLATQADALLFGHGGPGNWIAPNQKVRVGGVFTISASSQGTSVPPATGTPTPINVVPGNPKIRST